MAVNAEVGEGGCYLLERAEALRIFFEPGKRIADTMMRPLVDCIAIRG